MCARDAVDVFLLDRRSRAPSRDSPNARGAVPAARDTQH